MKIAIVGATGKVGRMMLTALDEFDIVFDELDLYASQRSAGTKLDFRGVEYTVLETIPQSFEKGYDFVLFSAGSDTAKVFAPIAAQAGAIVIDNSSAFRREDDIPLIVPEINGHTVKNYKGIIANPNCSTIQLVLILHPLNKYKKIKKVVVTTMQSVSGSGYKGILEMQGQRSGAQSSVFGIWGTEGSNLNEDSANNAILPNSASRTPNPEHLTPNTEHRSLYPRQIDLNVIPQIGDFRSDGFCQEEAKMTFETRKILDDWEFDLVATTVRVPVVYGHSESVYVEFYESVSLDEIHKTLEKADCVALSEDYLTPFEIGESNLSHISRIRYGGDNKSILFWNVAHNVRLGAATNAVKIIKLFCNKKQS